VAARTTAARSNLIAAIEHAWAETPPPSEGGISYNQELDDERAELEASLRGRHWREVPRETLFAWRTGLAGLSPAGFRYYLPAFLLAGLENAEIGGFLLYHFEAGIENGSIVQKLSSFSTAEREALRAFFQLMAAEQADSVHPSKDWQAVAEAVLAKE